MIRGTTPTLESTLPFDTSLIAEMYVTIAQGEKTVLEKTLSDCNNYDICRGIKSKREKQSQKMYCLM